jgi:transposase
MPWRPRRHDLDKARCIAALGGTLTEIAQAFMQERKASLPQRPLPANKIRRLLHFAAFDDFNKTEAAKKLGIARSSATKYIKAFKATALTLTDIENVSSANFGKLLFPSNSQTTLSDRKVRFLNRIESVHSRIERDRLSILDAWREEVATQAPGYKYTQFSSLYGSWRIEHGLRHHSNAKRKAISIRPIDIPVLNRWRLSRDRRKWEVAIALLNSSAGISTSKTAEKIERSPRVVERWYSLYERDGIESLPLKRTKKASETSRAKLESKKINLIKIIHESPKAYDINRASWSLKTLSGAYHKTHGERISVSSISEYFTSAGYRFKKAKKVLTSDDPNYREKLAKITDALSQLAPNEKFFSIDEFGPFSIRIRGGIALVSADEVRTIPQRQKSKGSLICTAALELSTNQILHFYSKKKNTEEMIKLLRRLLVVHKDENRLFVSWDAASWHVSKKLNMVVDEINSDVFRIRHKTPLVDLLPLPSGAQFLNVIESVFSGMARAILHNSNYQSMFECKEAIDRYFAERNRAFLEHPRRAGNKIWGKERVEAVFREENNCKDPRWR